MSSRHGLLARSPLILALALAGCGATSPPVALYTLSAIEPAPRVELGVVPPVALGPVTLAAYLDRDTIVTRTSANEISVSQRNRWAEPLDRTVGRLLLRELETRLAPSPVMPFERAPRGSLRVGVQVDRLDRLPDGSARLEAGWWIADGPVQSVSGRSEIEVEASAPGHAGSVAAMSEALHRLAGDLADALVAHAAGAPAADPG